MEIVSGVGAPMARIIMALSVLFVIAIGFGERRRLAQLPQKKTQVEEG
jgi:hypothetical protein